jgi:hypothetical protein
MIPFTRVFRYDFGFDLRLKPIKQTKGSGITWDMLFDFATVPTREQGKLLLSTVIPRPIAWIVSMDRDGQLNAAPFFVLQCLFSRSARRRRRHR